MEAVLCAKESFRNYRRVNDSGNLLQGTEKLVILQNFVTYLSLYESELYSINDLNCYFDSAYQFIPNYSQCFSINIPRKGYFSFHSYKHDSEEYANRMVLEKPGCEFRLVQEQAGEGGCTVFSFSPAGYDMILQRIPIHRRNFFTNPDWFSTVINSHAGLDYLHYSILQLLRKGIADLFQVDCVVMELVETVVDIVLGENVLYQPPNRVKCDQLRAVERAKEYLLEHFSQTVSLKELARYCHVSEFHFTRMFKQICGYSPFEYLQLLRIKNAEVLLTKTELPVRDVAFQSGFTRADYFSDTFANRFGLSPREFRIARSKRL